MTLYFNAAKDIHYEPKNMKSVFGLHITKCAGTSLADAVVKEVGQENSLLCSSFTNKPHGRFIVDFPEVDDIKFGFGHYLHMGITGCGTSTDRPFLFTILRNPEERIISLFRQRIRECNKSGMPLITADVFLRTNANTLTIELLRSLGQRDFPRSLNKDDTERAVEALSLFDCIVESNSEELDYLASLLKSTLSLKKLEIKNQNTSEDIFKSFGENELFVRDFCHSNEEEIKKRFEAFNQSDIDLFSIFKSSQINFRNNIEAPAIRESYFGRRFESKIALFNSVLEHTAHYHNDDIRRFSTDRQKQKVRLQSHYWSLVCKSV